MTWAAWRRGTDFAWISNSGKTQVRKSSASGPDTEVWLSKDTPPDDARQPSPPFLVQATTSANNQAVVSCDMILG
jgi:hypothetical protein